MSFYRFAVIVVRMALYPFFRVNVSGLENIPKEGSVLLCFNHISNFDAPLIGTRCPRDIHFLAKAELFEIPILKTILKLGNVIPVKRGSVERETLRQGNRVLKEGHVLGIFPEGTTTSTEVVGKGLPGAGYFALRSNATIIPCGIIGSDRLWSTVRITYGKPIDFTDIRSRVSTLEEAVEIIMQEIRKLVT